MRCERCAGLVVAEQFIGGETTTNGGWAYCGWRCVNCGAIAIFRQTDSRPVLRSVVGGGKRGRAKSIAER
jgi:hypothetical protein